MTTLSHADTLQLVTNPYGESGPYNFYVNGSSTTTPLICFSDSNLITWGEQWTADVFTINSVQNIKGDFAGSQFQYNVLGYLADELFANPGNGDIQQAIWYVLGKGGANNSDYVDAENYVNSNQNYKTTDIFYIPVPVDGSWSSSAFDGLGEPQPFVGQTPEPASLLLMGTGMLALAGALRRKAGF
jgi:hypothetical protein